MVSSPPLEESELVHKLPLRNVELAVGVGVAARGLQHGEGQGDLRGETRMGRLSWGPHGARG